MLARSFLSLISQHAARSRPCRRVVSPFCLTITTTIFSIVNHGLALFENHGNLHLRLNPKVTCLPLPESPSLPDSIGSRLQQGNISESRPDQRVLDLGTVKALQIAGNCRHSSLPPSSHPLSTSLDCQISLCQAPGPLVSWSCLGAPRLASAILAQASLSSSFPALTRNLFSTTATRQAKQRADQTPRVTGTGLSLSGALRFVKPATDASYRPPACLDLH
ncbi:hypothetical protein MRS44_001420 [Fusarium solani]|uniref:uncharacterized protein n=1 Tax=Fusarium solani TaxID=169388 RepID=UPI0032C3D73C|nr:hypothetical protein MRS44_001420 [Fusarium solani]